IRAMDGIKQAMGGRWSGLKLPGNRKSYVGVSAVEAKPFVDMHYEISAPDEQKQAFVDTRRGAMVSREVAEEFGWQLGDIVHFEGTFLPASVDVEVVCIFESTRHGFAQRDVWIQLPYFNERLDPAERDKIN